MSTIVTQSGRLHYQTVGHGEPLILLHGWVNSWDVWRETMLAMTSTTAQRIYALDFWGFGASSKTPNGAERRGTLESYGNMVRDFMDSLGIQEAAIAGHSMGGTVALIMALRNPERVSSLILVGAPIVGSTLNPFLRFAGFKWTENLAESNRATRAIYPHAIQLFHKLILAKDSERVREMILRDMQRATMQSFFHSIGDLCQVDLRDKLGQIEHPILGIYGARDNLVSPSNARILLQKGRNVQVEMEDRARHFPMTEQPYEFAASVDYFLSSASR